ncbi:hypothetical protein GCM10027341_47600 [Spirosoma knui]
MNGENDFVRECFERSVNRYEQMAQVTETAGRFGLVNVILVGVLQVRRPVGTDCAGSGA